MNNNENKTNHNPSILLLLGGLLAVLAPVGQIFPACRTLTGYWPQSLDESNSFTADQVARFVVTEDSTLQLIDLRTPEEFRECNIPGSVNIPYAEFLEKDPGPYSERSGDEEYFLFQW